jgi:hypothetical protein
MHARKSNDNGVSWLPDDVFSDVASPLPLQVDPGIRFDYAGDYDYGSAVTTSHRHAWMDGRVIINGNSQQDAFTDTELVNTPTPTPTATPCGSIIQEAAASCQAAPTSAIIATTASPRLRCHSLHLTIRPSSASTCHPMAMPSSRLRITPRQTFACRGRTTTTPSCHTGTTSARMHRKVA